MTSAMNRGGPRTRLFTWLVALAIGGAMTPTGCTVDRDDSYELVRRVGDRGPGEPTPLRHAAESDASASRVRRLMSDELSGELLRTFAMARRLVVETAPPSSARRARATLPPYLALGVNDLYGGLPYRDREVRGAWWRRAIPADAPIVWIDDEPARSDVGEILASVRPRSGPASSETAVRDAVVLHQIVSGLGRAIVSVVAPAPVPPSDGSPAAGDPVADGYVTFLEVVAAEWHSRAGDQFASDARAVLQRAREFAAVRGNDGIGRYRAECEEASPDVARDPLIIATYLYRLASSEAGHRLAPDETYRSMVPDLPPPGISPGRLLGAFRNFQAKLLGAWNRAVLADRRPRDLVDLLEAYVDAFPAERTTATRIFILTTDGRTVRLGGVDPRDSPERVSRRVDELTAGVLLGQLDLRGSLPADPLPAPRAL